MTTTGKAPADDHKETNMSTTPTEVRSGSMTPLRDYVLSWELPDPRRIDSRELSNQERQLLYGLFSNIPREVVLDEFEYVLHGMDERDRQETIAALASSEDCPGSFSPLEDYERSWEYPDPRRISPQELSDQERWLIHCLLSSIPLEDVHYVLEHVLYWMDERDEFEASGGAGEVEDLTPEEKAEVDARVWAYESVDAPIGAREDDCI